MKRKKGGRKCGVDRAMEILEGWIAEADSPDVVSHGAQSALVSLAAAVADARRVLGQ